MKHRLLIIITLFLANFLASQNPDEFTIYILGDAGSKSNGKKQDVLNALNDSIHKDTSSNAAVVFLGDNIYRWGLYDPHDESLKKRINDQLNILSGYHGYAYFIPGNHDWNHAGKRSRGGDKVVYNGIEVLHNEEEYINNYFNQSDSNYLANRNNVLFYPQGGSPGPVYVDFESTKNCALLIIDSQWFLNNGTNGVSAPTTAQIETFEQALRKQLMVMRSAEVKNVLILSHHPRYTLGRHSRDTTNIQDAVNSVNKYIFWLIDKHISDFQEINFIFAAGHEHLLEYFEVDGRSYIVSGASGQIMFKAVNEAKPEIVGLVPENVKFVEKHIGFFEIIFKPDGDYEIFVIHKNRHKKDFIKSKLH